jgi:hypothetical protein
LVFFERDQLLQRKSQLRGVCTLVLRLVAAGLSAEGYPLTVEGGKQVAQELEEAQVEAQEEAQEEAE